MRVIDKFIIWYIEKRRGGECIIKDHDKLKFVHVYTEQMYTHIQKLLSDEWRDNHNE